MSRPRSYTDEQFRKAVKNSTSIAQVLSKLGIKPTGGNYTHFKVTAIKLEVDHSHFTGQASNKGGKFPSKAIPLSEVMVRNSTYCRYHLRCRLIKNNILPYKCAICMIDNWLDTPLSLHLDHINGDSLDNRLENLRLLCPNCHSQTDTYGGKNKKR